MKQTSLERKILCGQANRVADAEVAKIFLEAAAMQPLNEFFQEDQKLANYIEHVLEKAEDEKEQADPQNMGNRDMLTYGRVCGRLAEKHKSGEMVDILVIDAVTCGLVKYQRENLSGRRRKNGRAPESDQGKGGFKRESLDCRLERAKKTVKEEKAQERNERQPSAKSLACCYSDIEEKQEISVASMVFVINHINMREYFQALSLITGKEEDAHIPETLPFCENMTIKELLDAEYDPDEMSCERVYTFLIEPFAKIDAQLDAKQ